MDIKKLQEEAKNFNVLLVEDNEKVLQVTKTLLLKFFKDVKVAFNGKEGLEIFGKEKFDIVITDINMPKMNGLVMIRKIRQIDQEVPIIVLSAYNETNYFIELIKEGVDGYLIKPIQFEQLTTTLQKVVSTLRQRREAERYKYLLEQYKEAVDEGTIVSKTDTTGKITYVNENFEKISKYSKEELIGKPHNIIRHPDVPKDFFKKLWETILAKKTFKGVIRNLDKDGKTYYVQSTIKPILDNKGNIQEFFSIRQDITHTMNPKKLLLEALKEVKNKLFVLMKLEQYSLLEEFYPQEILEKLEKKVLNYLNTFFYQYFHTDYIFHLGNGEYALLIEKNLSNEQIVESLKKVQKKIQQDEIIIDQFIQYNISVLISVVYEGDYFYESAIFGLKKLEKEQKYFIVANNLANEYRKRVKENIKVIKEIKYALNNDSILVYYQPIVDSNTSEIVKYEALVRMRSSNGEIKSPFYFLGASKLSNLYPKITQTVIERTITLLHNTDKRVSINLSVLDIENDEMRSNIIHILSEHRPCVDRITFELLEDEKVHDFKVVKNFIKLIKSMGATIAIDDFGKGYSNYSRLIEYEPDFLKIDGSLIKDIDRNPISHSVVKSIVTFAKEQKMKTVAEFVENDITVKILQNLGVDLVQGYFFGKPQPLEFKDGGNV
ncbi:EAL domain-containing response regulator [Nitrosophilus labii]|uniref:EAL domain-containing response regulator n=1 Tax=Nitrosophilus labii TaxID=2706014 RepID=UPI0016569F71|nr:EAL domain-containing protein [Nitrosophilus labii]